MSAPRKIWAAPSKAHDWRVALCTADTTDLQKELCDLYHHDDVVRELREALSKIADTDVWGQSMHHALNTRIRIATDALAKIAQEDVQ